MPGNGETAGMKKPETSVGKTEEKERIKICPETDADYADRRFMRQAIRQAEKAAAMDEVPIGCVIVRDGKVFSRGYNRRMTDRNTLAHAELTAIRKACKKAGDWRLEDCTLYVTLEPCPMCAGAIIQARIKRVVFAAKNPKAGSAGSCVDLLHVDRFNHQAEVTEGVLGEECGDMLKAFFKGLRDKKKKRDINPVL